MFPGFISPPIDGSFQFKKSKCTEERHAYSVLEEPVISQARLSMNIHWPKYACSDEDTSSDSESTSPKSKTVNMKLKKSHSVESSNSSDGTSSPLPETFDSEVIYNTKQKTIIPKIAGRTVRSVISSLSPKISKKKYEIRTKDPLWPNSMNTFARGITTSRTSTMVVPEEPSILALTLSEEINERNEIRKLMQALATRSIDLISFGSEDETSPSPLTDKSHPNEVCQHCHNPVDWTGINFNTVAHPADQIEPKYCILTEAPPNDEFFA